MDTNTTATLYLPGEGGGWTRLEASAFWPKTARLASAKTAVEQPRPGTVYLPLANNPQLAGVDIPVRSYIVRGSCSAVLGEDFPLKRLLKECAAQTVTAASLFDFSPELHHWELEVEG